ncbi:MAG: exopolysaccharide biosynthesis protein [Shimia sp.]
MAQTDTPTLDGPLSEERPVEDVLDRLRALSRSGDGSAPISLGEVMDAFGGTSFLPLTMLLGLALVSPLSGIPLLSSIVGLTIAAISVQHLLGRRHIWLPGPLERRSVPRKRIEGVITRMRGVARWFDRLTRVRLRALTTWPVAIVVRALVVICGLSMPFMEVVPMSSSVLGLAVFLFCLGQLTRDGAFLVAGMVAMAGAYALVAGVATGAAALLG